MITLDGAELQHVSGIADRYLQLTLNEAWTLSICLSRGYRLICRSPHLLQAATQESVTVRDTLWLFDKLVIGACLSPWEAAECVKRMQTSGRSLNQSACDRFIQKWGRLDEQ